jgi:hypothetical protein
MLRPLARACLTLCLILSVVTTGLAGLRISRDPLIAPLIDRSGQQIVAATDRLMAEYATADQVAALMTDRLGETPRNWVAIEALEEVAAERGLALPPGLTAARTAAWEEDSDWLAGIGECARCAYDPAACTLSNVLLCQVPIALTPLGDIVGLSRAGTAAATGGDVDEIDLGLSIIGLGATALVLASGGSSAAVKIGASTARLARRMNLLSPRLMAEGLAALRRGVDWAALPAVRNSDDLARVVRMDALAPVVAVVGDMGRIQGAVGTTRALHMLAYIDDAADARRMARATEALGARSVGRIEVLGKARFLRATIRWSDAARTVMAGLLGLLGSLAALVAGALQGAGLRLLRRFAR